MAIIKQGILGGFSNKVGSVVGAGWKGIATMRSLPQSVANPRTTAQVANRTTFAQLAQLGSVILPTIIQPLWNRWAKKMSGYNEWLSVNKKLFDESASISAYLPNAVFANGDLSANATAGTISSAGVVNITFDDDLVNAHDAATDEAYVVVGNVPTVATELSEGKIYGFATGVARSAGSVSVNVDAPGAGEFSIAYLMFRSKDGVYRSTTSFIALTNA